LGHARGVCMLLAAQSHAEVVEYATRDVKKGVTGKGSSDKWSVKQSLQLHLGKILRDELDATDALALAVHHAQNLLVAQRIAMAKA
jgi:crossover junction endodeoxyribonuclease RuvC